MTTSNVPASVLAVLAMGCPTFGMIFNDADPVIAQHRTRQDELLNASRTIIAQADAEKRELTAEENTSIDNNTAEFDRLDAEIDRRDRINNQSAKLATPNGRKTEAEPINAEDVPAQDMRPVNVARPAATRPAIVSPGVQGGGNGGFRSFGDYAVAVYHGSMKGGIIDKRLEIRGAAAGTIGSEGVGADGGFAVPPDFRAAIMAKVFGQSSLLGLAFQVPVAGNSLTMPIDMTTPWQSSGGIQAYWDGEAVAATQSKPALEQVTVRASKLRALVPITEELLEDTSAMGAYLGRKAPEKIDFAISFAFAWGNGVGKPLGFMNSPCLVTAATASAADTISATDVSNMFARLPTSSVPTAVWLVHPSAMAQLPLLVIGQMPVFLPPSGLAAAPNGTLLGRPVIPHQVCSSIGDLGDIMLVDMNEYLVPIKAGGIRQDTSMHLWFDQDITAFKFTIRLGGQPWWSSSTASRAGTFAQSPFVVLAAR